MIGRINSSIVPKITLIVSNIPLSPPNNSLNGSMKAFHNSLNIVPISLIKSANPAKFDSYAFFTRNIAPAIAPTAATTGAAATAIEPSNGSAAAATPPIAGIIAINAGGINLITDKTFFNPAPPFEAISFILIPLIFSATPPNEVTIELTESLPNNASPNPADKFAFPSPSLSFSRIILAAVLFRNFSASSNSALERITL